MADEPENRGATGDEGQARRDAMGRFLPGQSGNPGGRPKKVKEFVELCRELGAPTAFASLMAQMEAGTFEPAVVKAAELILAYAWGKPTQPVEHSGADGAPLGIEVRFVESGDR